MLETDSEVFLKASVGGFAESGQQWNIGFILFGNGSLVSTEVCIEFGSFWVEFARE